MASWHRLTVIVCGLLASCGGRVREEVPPVIPPPPPRPAPRAVTADELLGLDEAGVQRLLGAPAETRTDGAARVLSYRAPGCNLEVALFMDVKAGGLRVLSYQSSDGAPLPAKCYAQLRRAR